VGRRCLRDRSPRRSSGTRTVGDSHRVPGGCFVAGLSACRPSVSGVTSRSRLGSSEGRQRGNVALTENLTVLFTDLVGSTELTSALTVEAADELRRQHFSLLRQAIASHGGTEVKSLGDGLMVVFTSAASALACAVVMQQLVERHGATADLPLLMRIGVSAGELVREGDDYFGEPVIEASRLCGDADGGQILVADLVRALAGRRCPLAFSSRGCSSSRACRTRS